MSSDDPLSETDVDERERADADAGESADRSREDLVVELERLRERNRRLQATYERARQSQYRRTALGLAALGLVGVGGAALVPDLREVLLVLGAIGLFGGLLTYYLTPERFVAAAVSRSVYDAMASDRAALAAELGLTETHVYVPPDGGGRTRLFVPQYEDYDVPESADLESTLVVSEGESERGVTFTPTGEPLYESFLESLPGEPATQPAPLVGQLTDALVEQFELTDTVELDRDTEADRLTIGIDDTVYGPPDQFDNPVVSFFAVGLTRGLDEPVTVDVEPVADGRTEFVLTARWEAQTNASS